MERVGGGGWKANVEIYPTCPRCGSSNTKFCYYNNYSLTQPRYFCKGCRRYWTKGGSLRNIPVGGGCRKTRRERKSSSRITTPTTTAATTASTTLIQPPPRTSNINIDLAQVYANFLNPQQQREPEMSDQFEGLVMFPNHQLVLQDTSFGDHEFGISYVNNDHGTLHGFCGFNSINSSLSQQRDCLFGLPPLPGEEMGWSDTLDGGIISDVHHVRSVDAALPPSGIQDGQVLDPSHLLGNGDGFDNYETLFRP